MSQHSERQARDSGRPATRVYGPLYAFLYATVRRRLAGWLQFLALLAGLVAWLFSRSAIWLGLGLAAVVALRLLYWQARRDGYVRFVVRVGELPPENAPIPAEEEKISLRATGRFSVVDEEVYLVNGPAHYWRAPIGDHALMIRRADGRFVYQFVQVGALESVRPGWLIHGRQPRLGLAVTFFSNWGPEFVDETAAYYLPAEDKRPDKLRRAIYLTFQDEAARQSVWRSLIQANKVSDEVS